VSATFDILSQNIHLNHLQELVQLLNAGAGAKAGETLFSSDEDTGNHMLRDDELHDLNQVLMPLITIDSLAARKIPSLIKMDVEGFETEVLKGMRKP